MHRIIPRGEWGAVHDDGAGPAPLPAAEVWLHHSVTVAPDLVPPFTDDYAAVRTLERIGEQRFGRGISYTFPITPAGLIFQGHSVDRRGAHTAGHNTVGRAICFVGNYEVNKPTEAQLDSAAWLLVHGWLSGWWRPVALTGGHRDVKGTTCPGRHAYAAIPEINRRAKALADSLFTMEDDMPLSDDDLNRIASRVWGTKVHFIGDAKQPATLVMRDIATHARAGARSIDVPSLAEEIATRLPGTQGPVSVTDLEQALRSVLGSLDED